jgi:Na+/H+-dicarboxylate symporter
MNKRLLNSLFIFGAMALGILTGWSESIALNNTATIVSDLFLKLLKLISLPIIFLAIASTVSGMTDFQEMKRMGRKVLGYTIGTTIVAATIALLLFIFINPTQGQTLATAADMPPAAQGSYLSFALNIIPSNFVQAFIDNNVIGVAFMAFGLSIAILYLPKEKKEFLHTLFSSLFAATIKMTSAILVLMPIAIWAFVTLLVRDFSQSYQHFNKDV